MERKGGGEDGNWIAWWIFLLHKISLLSVPAGVC